MHNILNKLSHVIKSEKQFENTYNGTSIKKNWIRIALHQFKKNVYY